MRVLVIDDHLLLGQMVAGLLTQRFALELQAVCGSVAEALPLMVADSADLLLLDLCLPGEDWQDAAQAFLNVNPQGALIILTGLGDAFELPLWLQPSLLGVVQKTKTWYELELIVAAWLRRTCGREAEIQERLQQAIQELSPREQRVFDGLGRGLANRDIAALLGLTPSTVDTYRKTICAKLGISGAELVRQAVLNRGLPPVLTLPQAPG